MLPWSKTDVFMGYKYGYTAAEENNTSSDIAGDRSFVVVTSRKVPCANLAGRPATKHGKLRLGNRLGTGVISCTNQYLACKS